MWPSWVKQTLHHALDLRRHVAKLGMIDPISSGIGCQRKPIYRISIDFVIQFEEDAEAGVCECRMGMVGKNVVVRKTLFGLGESFRCQVFFDREVGELYNWEAADVDDHDKTRTCRQYCFFGVFWTRICVERGVLWIVEMKCKYFCEFFKTKR